MTEASTLQDLAVMLAHANGRSLKLSARGGIFIAAVRYPGGSASLANETLSGAINGAIALLSVGAPTTEEPESPEVTPDPTGTRVGVPPAPEEPEL